MVNDALGDTITTIYRLDGQVCSTFFHPIDPAWLAGKSDFKNHPIDPRFTLLTLPGLAGLFKSPY